MDNNQKFLAKLLSYAIRGKKPKNIETYNVDWEVVFEEAKAHQIQNILFPILKELETSIRPNDKIMSQWVNFTFIAEYMQTVKIENMAHVLDKFNKEEIPVISLKGLVLRDLYPRPVSRSMSDVDILIHQNDFERSKELLFSMGYQTKIDTNPKEVRFYHKTDIMIELHWLLIEPGYIKNSDKLEKSVWVNKEESNLSDVPIYVLSPEDHVVYLILHMVMHIKYNGFGLRQLSDLVLLIESKRERINWAHFRKRVKEFDVETFTDVILLVCKRLLDLEIPFDIKPVENENMLIELLINDIFSAGVFGKKTSARVFSNVALRYAGKEDNKSPKTVRIYIHNIFPTGKHLAERYKYAKKLCLLVPVAWVHRLIVNLTDKNFLKNVISRFKIPKGSKDVYKKRVELLKWLGLRQNYSNEQD